MEEGHRFLTFAKEQLQSSTMHYHSLSLSHVQNSMYSKGASPIPHLHLNNRI